MQPPLPIYHRDWNAFLHSLEDAFGCAIPAQFRTGNIALEALLLYLQTQNPDKSRQAQLVIERELRLALSEVLALPTSEILSQSEMQILMPNQDRKAKMAEIQSQIDWTLPRLGLPIWAQYVWGAGLLIGFILQFIYPIWGLMIFWGGMILSFQVEKIATAFQYKTFGEWVARVIVLNWPSLEMGAVDEDRIRIAFLEMLGEQWPAKFDPFHALGEVKVNNIWPALPPQWHLLNGDALRMQMDQAELPGQRIVIRECMIVGPVQPSKDFFSQRAAFIHQEYAAGPEKYEAWVMQEFSKIADIPAEAELNLWFEDDLFCQTNLWFLLDHLLNLGRKHQIYRILPLPAHCPERWTGFAQHDILALEEAFEQRILLDWEDLQRGQQLWQAYQMGDHAALETLAQTPRPQWRNLDLIVAAEIQRHRGAADSPQGIMRSIQAAGALSFEQALPLFLARSGIYGFSDLQAKSLWNEIQVGENCPD